jgi:glycosyltransferase involved in cell wall biosynthesis
VDLVASDTLTDDERAVVDALEAVGSRVQLRVVPSARLADRWRRDGPDIAFACGDSAWAAVLAGWSAAVRVAVGVDGKPRRAWRSRLAERLADRLLAMSLDGKALAQELAAAGGRPGAGVDPSTPVSVVVTVLNEGDAVDTLVDSLSPQLGAGDELLLVDGGSQDDTVARARGRATADARIRVLEVAGANISAGRNAGIQAATHDVVACTDAGCRPEPGWLASLKSSFSGHVRPALVTGLYEALANRSFDHAMAAGAYPQVDEARRPGALVRLYGLAFGRTFDPTMPTGRSVAFTKEAWLTVGGFDEALETAEDVTFGRAIGASGGRCLLDTDAVVAWEQRRSLRATALMYYRYGLGGGRTADRRVIGRDLARAGAYAVAPVLLVWGGTPGRSVVILGAAAYLSLPFARALGKPRPVVVALLVPVAVALKDLAKAAGCVAGLIGRDGADREA